MRVSIKDLEFLVKRINQVSGSPETYGQRDSLNKFTANVGHYYLDQAYGGNKLVRTDNESGGIREISSGGFITKKELYNQIHGMLRILGE